MAFDTRLGLYEDPPPQEALKFIDAVQNFFSLAQKLMFSIPSNMVRRYIDTPAFKKFLKNADDILDIGQGFVDKKMRELKEMAEKDKEPSGDTQGNVYIRLIILSQKDAIPLPGGSGGGCAGYRPIVYRLQSWLSTSRKKDPI